MALCLRLVFVSIILTSCAGPTSEGSVLDVSDLVTPQDSISLNDCLESAKLFSRNPTEFLADYQVNIIGCEESEAFLQDQFSNWSSNPTAYEAVYSMLDDTYSAVSLFEAAVNYQIGDMYRECLNEVSQRLLCLDSLLSDNYAFSSDYDLALESAQKVLDVIPKWGLSQ